MLWILSLICSVLGSCWIVGNQWDRYATNPIVISIVKGFREWNVTIPGATICFDDKLDTAKTKELIQRTWNVTSGADYDYYAKFVEVVANTSIHSLDAYAEFVNDSTLNNVNLLEMGLEVVEGLPINKYAASVAGGVSNTVVFPTWTVLEVGICQSVQAALAIEVVNNILPNRENPEVSSDMVNCNAMGRVCTGSINSIKRSYKVYQHSPFEVPDITSREFHGAMKRRIISTLSEEALLASPDLRKLWPSQRRCYFYDEVIYGEFPNYSINLCRMQCRRNFIFEKCGCAPHFYIQLKNQPVCDIKGLVCAANNLDEAIARSENRTHYCKCYPACEESVYPLSELTDSKFFVTTFGWAVWNFQKTRYRRDIIFEFSDMLVSFGGTAALFLGCSLMSGIELFYFFTVRLSRFLGRKAKNGGKSLRRAIAGQVARRGNLMSRSRQ